MFKRRFKGLQAILLGLAALALVQLPAGAAPAHVPQPVRTLRVQAPPPPGAAPATAVTAAPAAAPLAYSARGLHHAPLPDLGLKASAAELVDLDTRQVLWEQQAHQRRAPASLTKIVTVMVALDHAPSSLEVVVPPEAGVDNPDWTRMGLTAGERLTVRELLYGIFLVSGNDAAETLARTLMPRDAFVAAMNRKASDLGLVDTHFVNPTGLDEAGHYSSAHDLAVAAGYLELNYPEAAAIAAVRSVVLTATAGHAEYRMVSLNKLLTWPYPGATGLKTGFTNAAGGCVAGSAQRGERHLVVVVLDSPVFFSDAGRLFDYGFKSSRAATPGGTTES